METLKVVWKDLRTRQRFVIGELSKVSNGYLFKYNLDVLPKAKEKGFKGLVAFPNFEEVYKSDKMFATFESRLPDKKRSDIKEVLLQYGLHEFDAFELLKKTEGRQPIDTLEFISPINLEQAESVREFFVAGVSHHDICKGLVHEECTKRLVLKKGDRLMLDLEPYNKYDECAVVVKYKMDSGYRTVGYIPTYYACEVGTAVKQDDFFEVKCEVLNFDTSKTCQECLKAKLLIRRKTEVKK